MTTLGLPGIQCAEVILISVINEIHGCNEYLSARLTKALVSYTDVVHRTYSRLLRLTLSDQSALQQHHPRQQTWLVKPQINNSVCVCVLTARGYQATDTVS